jgi:hypothetical protein
MDRLLGLGYRMGSTDPVLSLLIVVSPPLLAAAPRVVVRVPISSIKFDMKKRMRSYDIYIFVHCVKTPEGQGWVVHGFCVFPACAVLFLFSF